MILYLINVAKENVIINFFIYFYQRCNILQFFICINMKYEASLYFQKLLL